MTAHWSEKYLGIPWVAGGRTREEGLDCWGLLRLVLAEEKCIILDSCASLRLDDPSSYALAYAATDTKWQQIEQRTVQPFDCVALGRGQELHHVGVYIGQGQLLHTQKRAGSHITSLHRLNAEGLNKQLFYRYAGS